MNVHTFNLKINTDESDSAVIERLVTMILRDGVAEVLRSGENCRPPFEDALERFSFNLIDTNPATTMQEPG